MNNKYAKYHNMVFLMILTRVLDYMVFVIINMVFLMILTSVLDYMVLVICPGLSAGGFPYLRVGFRGVLFENFAEIFFSKKSREIFEADSVLTSAAEALLVLVLVFAGAEALLVLVLVLVVQASVFAGAPASLLRFSLVRSSL
jgi:hypothetical protein